MHSDGRGLLNLLVLRVNIRILPKARNRVHFGQEGPWGAWNIAQDWMEKALDEMVLRKRMMKTTRTTTTKMTTTTSKMTPPMRRTAR